ncbi:MAG: F0F1 ATP synthase subunit A [Enterococcus sp.]|nr:F0F1 ATP synthase subunit A [Enterococcus sp.]
MSDTGAVSSITFEPFKLRPQILTISLVFVILATLMIVYFCKLRKVQAKQAPKGYVLGVQLYVAYMRSLTVDVLGPKLECLTPYFVFLFAYVLLSNVTGVLGLDNPTASLTVTLSMGLVMFVGTFVVGFKFQKISYLKKFCFCAKTKKGKSVPIFINPAEVISQVAPLVSISFRL